MGGGLGGRPITLSVSTVFSCRFNGASSSPVKPILVRKRTNKVVPEGLNIGIGNAYDNKQAFSSVSAAEGSSVSAIALHF
jgi:hypothetical protein